MKNPNLLFIYTDEQRYDTLSVYGNEKIQMPNLNRLASESYVFEKAYVTQPVCTPSRSSLLTGLYPHSNGCVKNNEPLHRDTKCFPEILEDKDYVTAHFGKWHLGNEIFKQHGFDEWISIEDQYYRFYDEDHDQKTRSDYHKFLEANGIFPSNALGDNRFGRDETARLPEEFSKPAFLAQESSRFIMENQDNPFVLFVNFLEPHMPFFGPRDDQYDPDYVDLPENFEIVPTSGQSAKARAIQKRLEAKGFEGPLETEEDWRKLIARYWGLCSLVDTYIGKILDTLDECCLEGDTIVVFTSDHGDMMGSHRLLAKSLMFEESVRVPLLLRLPGNKDQTIIKGPVSQIDLVPTLLDLMGQAVPEHLQGKSLKSSIEEPEEIVLSDNVFIEWSGEQRVLRLREDSEVQGYLKSVGSKEEIINSDKDPVRAVIAQDGWKFNLSTVGESELYNLNEDPLEAQNLVHDTRYRELVDSLTCEIRDWQKRTNDKIA